MTRTQMINQIAEMAKVNREDAEAKYNCIKDFLYCNGSRIKDVDHITFEGFENEYFTIRIWFNEEDNVEC